MNKVKNWGAVVSADPFPVLAPFGNPDMSWETAKPQWGQGLCSGDLGWRALNEVEEGVKVFLNLPPS